MGSVVAMIFVGLLLSASPAFPWSGECVRVISGDTIVVKHDGKFVEIGLHGISCPKWGQNFALEATQFTENIVTGKPLEVMPQKGKSRLRTFANVSVEKLSLNEELVRAGLAWWQENYAPNDLTLAEVHVQAMKNKVGIWSDSDPVPPWKFRAPAEPK